MILSLTEAAGRLGLTARQLRYRIQQGQIAATKVEGRWRIEESALPRAEARRVRGEALTAAVDEALAPHLGTSATCTVRTLRAFQAARGACRALAPHADAHPQAWAAITGMLVAVARGGHAFHAREKRPAWLEARNRAAEAVAWLELDGSEQARAVTDQLEGEVLPALAAELSKLGVG